MSLSTLRTTYGPGSRRTVINRAIRAECPQGPECLDNMRALYCRIKALRESGASTEQAEQRLAHWESIRNLLAHQMEVKHGVGENTNRRRGVGA